MKQFLSLIVCVLMVISVNAQQRPTDLDKSPLDITYSPANYPILKMNGKVKGDPAARVIYSRPLKSNRLIFGGIIKYGEMWRLGANEATEIEFFKTARVGDKKVSKGRYSLFCIPTENKWTIIINKDNFSWGNFTYDSKKDVAKVEIPVQRIDETVEALTMYFEESSKGSNLVIMWENTKAVLPIGF
jgi:hypothetical protein